MDVEKARGAKLPLPRAAMRSIGVVLVRKDIVCVVMRVLCWLGLNCEEMIDVFILFVL